MQVPTHPHTQDGTSGYWAGTESEPQLWAREATGGLGLQFRCPSMAEAFRFRVKASLPTGRSNPEPG